MFFQINPALNFIPDGGSKMRNKTVLIILEQVNLPDPSTKEPEKITWTVCFAKSFFFRCVEWLIVRKGSLVIYKKK